MTTLFARRIPVLLGAGLLALSLLGHEGPEHEIEELSLRMAQGGETADLLLERAIEYRVLGKLSEASRDLQRAVRLAPMDSLLLRELAQIQLQRGRISEAMITVRQALQVPGLVSGERAAVLMIRSHCHAVEGSVAEALEDCSEALRWDPLLVPAYLERSAWQLRLKRHRERIEGLEQGIKQTGAGLLVCERIDALLDDSQWQRSLEAIGPELSSSRLKGSWKIRRARALLGLGRRSEAERDLQEAVSEIESRMPREVREPSLLMDRALAQELLGLKEAAIKDYQTAADCGGGDEAVRAVRRLRGTRPSRSFWPWRHRTDSSVSRSGG